ncbi:unnamed protein product [Moneuplotes crassus]|uniref:Uncharacterized protein n=1 Tax=Euplotes crassus TaxID=5936 RepID=A0AAD1UC48_EUPCR|nr:unnamed protein product [Moneuplotes crassus]
MSIKLSKDGRKVSNSKASKNKNVPNFEIHKAKTSCKTKTKPLKKSTKNPVLSHKSSFKDKTHYKKYFINSLRKQVSLKSSLNYFDGSSGQVKPLVTKRKVRQFCSPMSLLRSQYKQLAEGKGSPKKRKKVKSKKAKSSVWLKSPTTKATGADLKLVLKQKHSKCKDTSRRQNRTVNKINPMLKTNKGNNNDLILDGENMLDHSDTQTRTVDKHYHNTFVESQNNSIMNSVASNLHDVGTRSRKNPQASTLSYDDGSIGYQPRNHLSSNCVVSNTCSHNHNQVVKSSKNSGTIKQRKKSRDKMKTDKRLSKIGSTAASPKTKRLTKHKMLAPKLLSMMKSPMLIKKHPRLLKPRPKSSKLDPSKRCLLTNVATVDLIHKADTTSKRTDRKTYRRSLDICLKDFKHRRNRTPKHKKKLLTNTTSHYHQKSSTSISIHKKRKKSSKLK